LSSSFIYKSEGKSKQINDCRIKRKKKNRQHYGCSSLINRRKVIDLIFIASTATSFSALFRTNMFSDAKKKNPCYSDQFTCRKNFFFFLGEFFSYSKKKNVARKNIFAASKKKNCFVIIFRKKSCHHISYLWER